METRGLIQTAKTLGGIFSRNSPAILTALSVGGLVTTAFMGSRASIKAYYILDEERAIREENSSDGYYDPLTKREMFDLTWKCYIPTVAIGLATIGCIVGANHISSMRNAALASIYGITEAAFKEYQTKVVETIGATKELKVRDEVSADRLKANPLGTNEVIFTGKGEVMCYDSLSGRYFKSDIEQIRRMVNKLNQELLTDMFLTVNELYDAIGLSNTKLGDEMGWDLDKGLLEINFSAQLADDGEPCLVLNYDVTPRFMDRR